MAEWNTSAAGHETRLSVILLLHGDKVVLNQQFCVRNAAWSAFLSCFIFNFRYGSPSVRKNRFTGGHAIKYTKAKLNILHKIKLIDDLITFVERNSKEKH